MVSQTEENYLKAIFKIGEKDGSSAGTNALAAAMQTTAASATDMIKRLADKQLVVYEKYRGVVLTDEGNRIATALIRRHRLWEVFLTEKLDFAWDEVHELAEDLEHIPGEKLIEKLDAYLGFPRFDPHGDPIPDGNGKWTFRQQTQLLNLSPGDSGIVTGVNDHSSAFLQYLSQLGLSLGSRLEVLEKIAYDNSVRCRFNERELTLSGKVSVNLLLMTV